MSKLRSLNTSLWSDPWIEELTPEQKLLFIYLITNDKTNMLGIYESSVRKISFETGISTSVVKESLGVFEQSGKVKYLSSHVILLNYMKHQKFNHNMKKSAVDAYMELPKEVQILGNEINTKDVAKGFETLAKGFDKACSRVRKVEVEVEEEIEIEDEVEIEDEDKNSLSENKFSDEMNNPETNLEEIKHPEEEKKEKVPAKRKSDLVVEDEFSREVIETFNKCLDFFPEHLHPEKKSIKKKWLDTVEKLNRIDRVPFKIIVYLTKAAREDDFWSSNFLSLTKLRSKNKDGVPYILVFSEKFKLKKSRQQSALEAHEEALRRDLEKLKQEKQTV